MVFDRGKCPCRHPPCAANLEENLQPRLTITSSEAVEGQDLTFDLRLSSVSPRPLYILYGVVDANGQAVGRPQPFVFAAGQSQATLSIQTENNEIDEENKTLIFAATVTDDSPLKLTTPQIQTEGLVIDDDPDPIVTVSATPLVEGQEGELTLNIEGQTAKNTLLTLTLSAEGAAKPGLDIDPINLQIPLQDLTAACIPLRPIDDGLNENTEPLNC